MYFVQEIVQERVKTGSMRLTREGDGKRIPLLCVSERFNALLNHAQHRALDEKDTAGFLYSRRSG